MTTEITAKKILRTLGIILLFVVILGYGVSRSKDILFGVDLSLTGLTNGMHTTSSELSFSGEAKHVNALTVNGRIVPTAQDGSWRDTIALLPGYNVITITTTDKFKRTKKQTYRVFFDAPEVTPVKMTEQPVTPQVETPAAESPTKTLKKVSPVPVSPIAQ